MRVLCVAMLLVFAYGCGSGNSDPDRKKRQPPPSTIKGFGAATWGMGYAEVRKLFPEAEARGQDLVLPWKKVAGYDASVVLDFVDKKFDHYGYAIELPSPHYAQKALADVKADLTLRYGPGFQIRVWVDTWCLTKTDVHLRLQHDPTLIYVAFIPRPSGKKPIIVNGKVRSDLKASHAKALQELMDDGVVLDVSGTTYKVFGAHWATGDRKELLETLEVHSAIHNGTPYIRVVDQKNALLAEATQENGWRIK